MRRRAHRVSGPRRCPRPGTGRRLAVREAPLTARLPSPPRPWVDELCGLRLRIAAVRRCFGRSERRSCRHGPVPGDGAGAVGRAAGDTGSPPAPGKPPRPPATGRHRRRRGSYRGVPARRAKKTPGSTRMVRAAEGRAKSVSRSASSFGSAGPFAPSWQAFVRVTFAFGFE